MTEPDTHIERLARIAAEVLRVAPDAVVFGSAARGERPNDLDVFVSLSPGSGEAWKLLEIARRHYGWLDVFVRAPEGGRLLVRNDWASDWIVARNARSIGQAIKRDGLPLMRLDLGRPAEADMPPSAGPAPGV